MMTDLVQQLAKKLPYVQIKFKLPSSLLMQGASVPFIARYRKESDARPWTILNYVSLIDVLPTVRHHSIVVRK